MFDLMFWGIALLMGLGLFVVLKKWSGESRPAEKPSPFQELTGQKFKDHLDQRIRSHQERANTTQDQVKKNALLKVSGRMDTLRAELRDFLAEAAENGKLQPYFKLSLPSSYDGTSTRYSLPREYTLKDVRALASYQALKDEAESLGVGVEVASMNIQEVFHGPHDSHEYIAPYNVIVFNLQAGK